MSSCRSISNFARKSRVYFYKSRKYSTSVEAKTETIKQDEIVIPNRIHRGPTDILKALASTVSKDFTAPKYKYEDDPYFIPASNISKRAFALSKESGRKAARYFLEKYPEFFKCNQSVPHIKAFDPPVVYTEENVLSADTLRECITSFNVNDAVTVYNILKKKDISVSQEIKQDLLELLCFCNGSQLPDEDYFEERYFTHADDRYQEKWKSKGVAETLFKEMEQDSKAYSSMIAGTAKFRNAARAFELYEEMKSIELTPTLEAYNGLILAVPYMQEMGEARYELVMNLLNNMKENSLVPNLYTMNEILNVLSKSRRWRQSQSECLRILAEMKRLKIEPSLGTYSLVLNIFNSDDGLGKAVLSEVLKQVEGKELVAKHPQDVTFFTTAMDMCWKSGADKDLAYRINNLVELGNNCKLLGNSISESRYFKSFFKILCEVEEIDTLMEIYNKYVPNTYTPEAAIVHNVIEKIHFTGYYQYLPKICFDMLIFELSERENILSLAMEAAGIMKHEKEVQKELVDIVWKIVEKLNIRLQGKRFIFNWTGAILGNVLNTFVNGDDVEKTWSIIQQLIKEELSIIGYPEKEILLKVCEFFLQNQEYDKTIFCIKYAIRGAYPDFGDDFKKLTEDMYEKNKLGAKQRVHTDSIVKLLSTVDNSSNSSDDSSNSSDSSSSDGEDNK